MTAEGVAVVPGSLDSDWVEFYERHLASLAITLTYQLSIRKGLVIRTSGAGRVARPLGFASPKGAGFRFLIPALHNLPPRLLQAPRGNLFFKFGAVDRARGCVKDGANIP